jgi:hypothetical protein
MPFLIAGLYACETTRVRKKTSAPRGARRAGDRDVVHASDLEMGRPISTASLHLAPRALEDSTEDARSTVRDSTWYFDRRPKLCRG